jgi:protein-S-isoprenylcysteine O-methyltransferase Ste14
MTEQSPAYGLWALMLINTAVFAMFAFSFTRPRTVRDWRSFGAFTAFLVALFTEMYGFPLTIYLLSGWLGSRYPGLDLYSHEAGHLWQTIFGARGDAHVDTIHLASNLLIAAGFIIVARAWSILYKAQQARQLATTGPYAVVRHPQYGGFVLILLGFLVQWPTIPTLVMFPVLVIMYARLARREEREIRERFGDVYERYAARTPAFIPRWLRSSQPDHAPAA